MTKQSPIKITLEEGKKYAFCTCGYSNTKPLCDGSHREKAPDLKSYKYEAEKDGDVWVCQCQKTNNTPFCDGSHKEL